MQTEALGEISPAGEEDFEFTPAGGKVVLRLTGEVLTPFGGREPWLAFFEESRSDRAAGGKLCGDADQSECRAERARATSPRLSPRGAQCEESAKTAGQSARGLEYPHAQRAHGGGEPQGQPPDTRMGQCVPLRQQHAGVWEAAKLQPPLPALPASTEIKPDARALHVLHRRATTRKIQTKGLAVACGLSTGALLKPIRMNGGLGKSCAAKPPTRFDEGNVARRATAGATPSTLLMPSFDKACHVIRAAT
jgi:hypothetical protein